MGRYYVHKESDHLFFRMQGKMKYTSSMGFDVFLKKTLSEDIDSIFIDLQNVEYIDSTNLGLIAKMAEFLIVNKKNRLIILSTHKDINEILASMGFDQVCNIVTSPPEEVDYNEISAVNAASREIIKVMVDAHKKLIAISEDNQEIFQDVIELMEKDLE